MTTSALHTKKGDFMKPIKVIPAFKDYIWGGQKLRTVYGKPTDISPLAESWELSCHPDGPSVIVGGEHDGKTLDSYIRENPACLGTGYDSTELPILIKLIDAQDNLSVQVHPNDAQAKVWENQNGKTEMWYVVQADEGALMTCGMKQDTSKEDFEKAILDNTVGELLNTVPSSAGDVFFVEAGTVHAIGKGNVIAEIQQNSNVTYRLYDYGRVGKDGKTRELHIEKGVKASNCNATEPRAIPTCSDGTRLLGSCRYFAVKEIPVSGEYKLVADEKSYHALIVVAGSVQLECAGYSEEIVTGQTVFIPANLGAYTLTGNATVLQARHQPEYHFEGNTIVDEYGVTYGTGATLAEAAKASGLTPEDIQ